MSAVFAPQFVWWNFPRRCPHRRANCHEADTLHKISPASAGIKGACQTNTQRQLQGSREHVKSTFTCKQCGRKGTNPFFKEPTLPLHHLLHIVNFEANSALQSKSDAMATTKATDSLYPTIIFPPNVPQSHEPEQRKAEQQQFLDLWLDAIRMFANFVSPGSADLAAFAEATVALYAHGDLVFGSLLETTSRLQPQGTTHQAQRFN